MSLEVQLLSYFWFILWKRTMSLWWSKILAKTFFPSNFKNFQLIVYLVSRCMERNAYAKTLPICFPFCICIWQTELLKIPFTHLSHPMALTYNNHQFILWIYEFYVYERESTVCVLLWFISLSTMPSMSILLLEMERFHSLCGWVIF